MRRRITLSIAIAVSALALTLTIFNSTAKAQQPFKFSADTGVITLSANQVLRLTVVSVDGELGGGIYGVRLKQMSYTPGVCGTGGVCISTVAAQTTSERTTVMPGEAVLYEIPASFQGGVFVGVRGVVETTRRDLRVRAMVFDTSTQTFVAQPEFEMLN